MPAFLRTIESYEQGARTLPGRYYTSPEILAEEMERLMRQRWFCVGRAERIPTAGDYFLQALGNESLIVVRDRNGIARAFYNVCRHRGTRICEAEQGRFSETIQCPYHAWTYTTEGQLIGAPQMRVPR